MKIEPDIQPKLLTSKQTAAYLSISERKLWSLTSQRQIPCIRIGRAVRYSISDLDVWIESQRVDTD